MTITLDKKQIKEIIPHRDPILLVDEVIDMVPGEKIAAKYFISPDMDILKGHFPGNHIFPGVYTAESFGQVADILILSISRYCGKTPYLVGLNNVRYKIPVQPGHTILIDVEIISERIEKGIITCMATVRIEGEEGIAVEGEVTLAVR